MGGDVVGMDICDDCNHYFGTTDSLIPTPPRFAVELCVKEVMNISRHFFLNRGKQKQRLKSILFNYYESKRTLVDSSGLNVPPVAETNVPGIAETNVPAVAE